MKTLGLVTLVAVLVPLSAAQAQQSESTSGSEETEGGAGEDPRDAAARRFFESGREAYDAGDYQLALSHFRQSYDLSERPELLYNIGMAADRLRRDAEALEAFRGFVQALPSASHRGEVEARIRLLEDQVARQAELESIASQRAGEAEAEPEDSGSQSPVSSGPSTGALAGSIGLGVIGLGGVAAGLIAIAGAGCAEQVAGVCAVERETNWTAVGVYGGGGVLAIVGAILWLLLSGGDEPEESAVSVGPGGLELRGSF